MIFKSYLAEDDLRYFEKNKSVLFYGENLGLKNLFRERILATKKTIILRYNQDEILREQESFLEQILNTSLFDEEKIFLINDANDKILELFKIIENKLDNNKVYFFSSILDKKSKLRSYFEKSKDLITIACYEDNLISIKKIIQKELSSYKNLSNEHINIIADNCNFDRDKLKNELEKIRIYFSNFIIETDKLNILLNLKTNDDFDKIRDEALIGNKITLNYLLSETNLEKDKNIFYINVLNQRLNKIMDIQKIKTKGSLESAISEIKPPIFWKDKPIIIQQVKKWNLGKIKKILKDSYELEIKLKSGKPYDQNILVKMFLVNICNLANA